MSSSLQILIMLLPLLTYILSVPFFIIPGNAQVFSTLVSYEDCAPSPCGNSIIQYPFGKCGPLKATCKNGTIYLFFSNKFVGRVLGEITNASVQITQDDTTNPTFVSFNWITDNGSIFHLHEGYTMGTVSWCPGEPQVQSIGWLNGSFFFYSSSGLNSCNSYPIVIPNSKSFNISDDQAYAEFQRKGFNITWLITSSCTSCQTTGGRCIQDGSFCVFPNGTFTLDGRTVYSNTTPVGQSANLSKVAEIISPICAVLVTIVAVSCFVICGERSRKRTASDEEKMLREFMDPLDPRPPSLQNFLAYYKSQVPTRYSYSQIRAYTNNLADKIGKGGFGTVYKGKLPSGSLIAVKILDESKQSEHQFIAEVATVGRTYHVNLVRLLGYCFHRSKRALVYEYMVNGSLDKYIHGDENELDWKQLHSIAVGTARGIAYLHEECKNRILHCDIKPHNVLLDADFLPKVADFGLAKISEKQESHISVVNRGTLGYAAPEMWSRNHGPVTDRTDVYSYGMLIMEMVGGRKNIDFHNKQSRSSQFFYTEWAFKQVEKGDFGNLRKGNISEEDQVIAKQLSLVGLWCIQFNSSSRPPMSKVSQMLEGSVDITTPPFPFRVDTRLQRSASLPSSST